MWNALRVLLHRPLVADGQLHMTLSSTSKSSFAACTEAAMVIVKLVRLCGQSASMSRAPYLMSYGMCTACRPSLHARQNPESASATHVAATIHVRTATARASSSEANDHLRTCLRVSDQNSATNYAVRKPSIVIEALMKRMDVSVASPDTTRSGSPDNFSDYQAASTSENASDLREGVATYRGSMDLSPYQQSAGDDNNPEPTMVAGYFVPRLDVDTIIHSFMQGQQFSQQDTAFMPTMNTANTHQMGHNDGVDDEGQFLEDGDCVLPGISSTGTRVQMTFSKPSCAMTRKLLPSGHSTDIILAQTTIDTPPTPVGVSLVDAANPFCIVDATALPDASHEQGPGAPAYFILVENV